MKKSGKIFWQDLTVENAETVKDFYCAVAGWEVEEVKVGDHMDYNMIDPESKEVIAGICHKKGYLSKFPAQWLNYVMVEDISSSAEKCKAMGGEIIDGPAMMGEHKYLIVKDPEGAYLALMQ